MTLLNRGCILLVSLGLLVSLSACQSESEPAAEAGESEMAEQPEENRLLARWGYEGDMAPANWADLDAAYAECAGQSQSPIDLAADDEAQDVAIELDYSDAQGTLVDAGKVIQVNVEGGTMTIDGTPYELLQFHFHTPSEHTLNGERYPAEVHLVHADGEGMLAVLGIFYEEGEPSKFLAPVWEGFASLDSEPSMSMNVADMLPDNRVTYTYSGSLTTPPCSEVVAWHVMQEPMTLSPEQLQALTAIYDNNSRPVQPLNDREVDRVTM